MKVYEILLRLTPAQFVVCVIYLAHNGISTSEENNIMMACLLYNACFIIFSVIDLCLVGLPDWFWTTTLVRKFLNFKVW